MAVMMSVSKSRLALVVCLLCFSLSACLASVGAQSLNAETLPKLARSRAQHLRYGINLSEWFAQVHDPKGYTKEHFETWNTAEDISLIKAMGFDHVRLGVNPQPMFRNRQADNIPAEYLGELDAAVKMILDAGLAVMIDIHPDGEFKQKLATDGEFTEQFADFWRALAHHFSTLDPDLVLFEILNEPEARDAYRWYGVQARLAVAIREGAPNHTIIATGARWSDDDDLFAIEPLPDPNVIYTFHFYDPHVFTHQGATWGENYWHFVKALPYPSTPENVQESLAAIPEPAKRLVAARYGMDRWNAARIDEEFDQVSAWAAHWNVPVICNEFGVYRKDSRPEARAAWISDVRKSLERHGIGWTMWDYSGGFGVMTKPNGRPIPDELTVKALGRNMPPTN
jgi:endoglucanase